MWRWSVLWVIQLLSIHSSTYWPTNLSTPLSSYVHCVCVSILPSMHPSTGLSGSLPTHPISPLSPSGRQQTPDSGVTYQLSKGISLAFIVKVGTVWLINYYIGTKEKAALIFIRTWMFLVALGDLAYCWSTVFQCFCLTSNPIYCAISRCLQEEIQLLVTGWRVHCGLWKEWEVYLHRLEQWFPTWGWICENHL